MSKQNKALLGLLHGDPTGFWPPADGRPAKEQFTEQGQLLVIGDRRCLSSRENRRRIPSRPGLLPPLTMSSSAPGLVSFLDLAFRPGGSRHGVK